MTSEGSAYIFNLHLNKKKLLFTSQIETKLIVYIPKGLCLFIKKRFCLNQKADTKLFVCILLTFPKGNLHTTRFVYISKKRREIARQESYFVYL